MTNPKVLNSSVQMRRWAKLIRPIRSNGLDRDLSFLVSWPTVPPTTPCWSHVSEFVDLTKTGSVHAVTEEIANYCEANNICTNTLHKPCKYLYQQ
jgi:hypothetical protein